MSQASGRVRRWLIVPLVVGAIVLILGALHFAPAATPLAAQSAATPGSCAPYDSVCSYCQNHPTSSICPEAPTAAAATTAAPAATGAAPTAHPQASATAAATAAQPSASAAPAAFTVVASGLNNPRGLKFGPDGNLYVAEAGIGGGTNSTVGKCTQVVPPVGPYTGSDTGSRISMITPAGVRTTVVDNIPSAQDALQPNPDVQGVADVAFIGDTLYGLLAGAGCSHGVPNTPNGIIKANADGTWTSIANLSAFYQANPVAKPSASDFEPDGDPYSLIADMGNLYAVNANQGELEKITPDGTISRVVDLSATEGHLVPTAIALGPDGDFYVGNLFHFPVVNGDAEILKITPDGTVSHFATGLTAVTGLAFGGNGQLYALEFSAAPPSGSPAPIAPGTGRVVSVSASGGITPIAGGLSFPTAMTVGPDGALYVSNNGVGAPGSGQIVRIPLP